MTTDLQTVGFQLALLAEYDTLNGFLAQYYATVFDELTCAPQRDAELVEICAEFFDFEVEHQQRLVQAGHEEAVHAAALTALDPALAAAVSRIAQRLAEREREPRQVECLLAAECAYYMRQTDEVIRHLRMAVEAGCYKPVIQFSLGYNYFEKAAEIHSAGRATTAVCAGGDADVVVSLCTQAVRSFAEGLSGEEFDGQIYYWIGFVAEALGVVHHALHAYRHAAALDPSFAPLAVAKEQEWAAHNGAPARMEAGGSLREFEGCLVLILYDP